MKHQLRNIWIPSPDAQQTVQASAFRPRIEQAVDDALGKKPGSYTQTEMDKAKKSVLDLWRPRALLSRRLRESPATESGRRSNIQPDTAGKRATMFHDATAVAQRRLQNEIRNIDMVTVTILGNWKGSG